jgi:hypothetical protein
MALIWKQLQVAAGCFQQLNTLELLPLVYTGVSLVDGMKPSTKVSQQKIAV